jgi:hypothetical protein
MKKVLILSVALVLAVGCGSTRAPDPCGDPIEVPAPYWNPPKVTSDLLLDPPPNLITPNLNCPPETTPERCTELAIEAMVADYLNLLADGEQCRFKFDGLLKLIEAVPPVTPPPPVDAPPLDP